MSLHNLQRLVLILSMSLFLFVFVGCAGFLPGDTAVAPDNSNPTAEATLDIETIPSNLTGSVSNSAISTSPVITPSVPLQIGDGFFFLSQDPVCELPCWQGLVIGETTYDVVLPLLGPTIEFENALDIFIMPPVEVPQENLPTGYVSLGYSWTSEEPEALFDLVSWFDEKTNTLESLEFSWFFTDNFQPMMSPQDTLRELGSPLFVAIRLGRTEVADTGSFRLTIVYEEGIILRYAGVLPILQSSADAGYDQYEFCLGRTEEIGSGEAFIVEPFTSGLDTITYPQKRALGSATDETVYGTLEGAFGVTLEEATDLARQDGDACLYRQIGDP